MFKSDLYSFRKCRKILQQVYHLYKRKKNRLLDIQKRRFENILISLQAAIVKKNQEAADRSARNLEMLCNQHLKKNFKDQFFDVVFALVFALVIAVIVRQTWFEPFNIPTGSMRPTFKENDFVVVSKNDFCLNIPLTTSHFYFDPQLINRGGIVIFTGANLDIRDVDMMYFYLFPGKKQLIKRLIGKPKDTLYFYGGQIYGIDAQGKDIKELRQNLWFEQIEHIPFIRFEGKVITSSQSTDGLHPTTIFYQTNEPVAKIGMNQLGQIEGEILSQASSDKSSIKNYYDLWGFKNFAMARILSKDELHSFYSKEDFDKLEDAPLYLELTHHPSFANPKMVQEEYGAMRFGLSYSTSFIPLKDEHLKKIFESLYTARFIVKDKLAYRYGSSSKYSYQPTLNIPDGTYEFFDGVAYEVKFGGLTKKLPSNHPIYQFSYAKVQTLYNLGIEFNTLFAPHKKNQFYIPSRYSYFKNNNLYLMNHPIFQKDDPILLNFLHREYQKQSVSITPYLPFEDLGPPLDKDGNIDKDFIRKHGITIPDKMYLVLGDNHAMSGDSREFGFVPESNLRGGATFIFWPPQDRFGRPLQPPYSNLSLPKVVTWTLALTIGIIYFYRLRNKLKKPLKF
ncbi:MAG: signal peptidase I [Chlamydiae bacterium]|nr:signal peptidase I [Chlamydiota bacterium]